MIKLISNGEFNTSFGRAFVVEKSPLLKVGAPVEINGEVFTIKKIMLSSQPTEKNVVGVFV